MPKLVRSASLTDYREVALSVGLDPERMLRSVGLSLHCLRDPDLKIREEAVRALLEASAEAAGIEDFGLRMVERRGLSNLGALALLVRDQPTVRKALEAWIHNRRVHTDSISFHVEESGGVLTIGMTRSVQTPSSSRQTVEMTIGVVFGILRRYLGDGWKPRVCFTHSAPRNRDAHRRVFGSKVEFNRGFNGIVCAAKDLESPMPAADPSLLRYAQQYVDSIGRADESFGEKVRELVAMMLSSGHCRIERVAEHLGMDRKTVYRRLADEGTSFSAILDAIRTETVKNYLRSRERSLADVAEMLGFSDMSAFSRWFKRRFGIPVSAWRASNQPNGKVRPISPS